MTAIGYLVPIIVAAAALYLGRHRIADFARALGQIFHRGRELPAEEPSIPLTEVLGIAQMDERRRNILKMFGLGAGAFVIGKVIGPSLNLFPESLGVGTSNIFNNFRVVENGNELGFYDLFGNEILVLENNADSSDSTAD